MVHAKKFTFKVRFDAEEGGWVGLCPAFPTVHSLAPDPVEALLGVMETVDRACRSLRERGEPLPGEEGGADGLIDRFTTRPPWEA